MVSKRTLSIQVIILSIIIVILVGVLIRMKIDNTHYKRYKNIISQEEVEKTLFEQPISEERDGEFRIGIKTAIDGDFHAELTIYKAENGKYNPVFTCPAVVGKNGPGKQSEGDTKTPLGTWEVGKAYGINDNPGSLIPYTKTCIGVQQAQMVKSIIHLFIVVMILMLTTLKMSIL